MTSRRLRNALAATTALGLVVGASAGGLVMAETQGGPVGTEARDYEQGYADLVESLLPAVVAVRTERSLPQLGGDGPPPSFRGPNSDEFQEFFRRFFGERMPDFGPPEAPEGRRDHGGPRFGPQEGVGSGFVLQSDGLVVTNNHVVEGSDQITVVLNDGTELSAEILGRDPSTDLALLKVEPAQPLPFVRFGDSDALRVGDKVLAIGSPFGLGSTVTSGIVSARSRDIGAGPYDDFLQIDAAINRGNSGGPTFNLQGEVVGVNTAIFSPSGGSVGIGFAIPANLAEDVIADLQDDGQVERGFIGVTIQTVTDELAAGLDLGEPRGALVSSVSPDGPAAEAGVQRGDVIVGFGDQDIAEMRELPRAVASQEPGEATTLRVWRDGEELTLDVELGLLPSREELAAARSAPEEAEETTKPRLGLSLAPLTPEKRQELGLAADVEGAVIESVDPNGPAASQNLRPGDVIMQVARSDVGSPQEVAEAVDAAEAAGEETVLLLVERDGQARFVAVRLGVS
jgi:serine protease Do